MRIAFKCGQLLPTFNQTITVFNKLKAIHSDTKRDVWHKTVIPLCSYVMTQVSSAEGNALNLAAVYVVRVEKNSLYLDYADWIKVPTQGFTFSLNDLVIKGEVEETEITNASAILQKYQPNAFLIKTFSNNTGAVPLAEHYCLKGG